MTDKQQHPITPPFELKRQWRKRAPRYCDGRVVTMEEGTLSGGFGAAIRELWLIDRAAEWGYEQHGEVNEAKLQQARDEELEACCEWLGTQWGVARTEGFPAELRDARRPKPPNLKDLALSELETILNELHGANGSILTASAIRRALEALPDD